MEIVNKAAKIWILLLIVTALLSKSVITQEGRYSEKLIPNVFPTRTQNNYVSLCCLDKVSLNLLYLFSHAECQCDKAAKYNLLWFHAAISKGSLARL